MNERVGMAYDPGEVAIQASELLGWFDMVSPTGEDRCFPDAVHRRAQ